MTKLVLGMLVMMPMMAGAAPAVRSNMLVSTDWLARHLGDPKVVVLHVAAARAVYDAGHIPGARFVALPELAITRNGVHNELPDVADLKKLMETAGVSDDSRVIVYGDASVLPATRAYFTLDYLGHGDDAALLDGGLEKWRHEGRALSTDAVVVKTGSFTPRVKAELVAQMETVQKMGSDKTAVLLDSRQASDYKGEKGAHIPGALNLYWMEDQVSKENQTLRTEAMLREQYAALGVTPDKRVVTYCNSGMQALQSYFTLKYLGYDVRMYDGSMSEWNLKNGPVEK